MSDRPTWANTDPGVWVLVAPDGDFTGQPIASVKPNTGPRGGYRFHWYGFGRGNTPHWMHAKRTFWGLAYALEHVAVKTRFKIGRFYYPDLGIEWSQVHLIEHTIGHWTGPTRHNPAPYRNLFRCNEESNDYANCMNLVATGLMRKHGVSSDMHAFIATDAAFPILRLPVPKWDRT